MIRPALLALATTLGLAFGAGPRLATARPQGEAVAPLASWTVTTSLRTLRGLPTKGVITTPAAWDRVTDGLAGAPARPDLTGRVVALVVADTTGDVESWIDGVERLPSGDLRVLLYRREGDPRVAPPEVTAFLLLLPEFPGGVRLEHRTLLGEGSGYIQRPTAADAALDRDPAVLPRLGPDLRLSFAMHDGSAPPANVHLRLESRFPVRRDIPDRVSTEPFPAAGRLGLRFPRVRDLVQHVYAAYAEGLRSRNPLVIRKLPADAPGGSPAPIEHRFLLEPIPGRR